MLVGVVHAHVLQRVLEAGGGARIEAALPRPCGKLRVLRVSGDEGLQDRAALTFNVWITAWEERADGRYWKRAAVANGLAAEELPARLADLLEAGRAALVSWVVEDLERAGH